MQTIYCTNRAMLVGYLRAIAFHVSTSASATLEVSEERNARGFYTLDYTDPKSNDEQCYILSAVEVCPCDRM